MSKPTSQPPIVEQSDELLISTTEAARRIGLDRVAKDPERAVLQMVRRGEIRGVRTGRWILIDPQSLARWAEGK